MSNFTKPMKRSFDILTRLFDKDKWIQSGRTGKTVRKCGLPAGSRSVGQSECP